MPRLFFIKKKTLSPIVGALSTTPFKKYVLGLLNSVTLAKEKYLSLQWLRPELIRAVMWWGSFSNTNHRQTLGGESHTGQKDWDSANETKLKGFVRYLKGTNRRLILFSKNTGAWLSVSGTTVSGTVLSE